MITAKFFSKQERSRGVFGAALRGHLGFMVANFILLFIVIVVPFLVAAPNHAMRHMFRGQQLAGNPQVIQAFYADAFRGGIYLGGAGHALAVAIILSIVAFACALSSSRYIHSMKMTDLYHSLPVRREKLMLSNLAASMIATLGPLLVLTVFTMLGILIAYGGFGWVAPWFFGIIALDLFTIAAAVFVMYAFTTLISVQVGTTFDAFALTGLLGFVPTVVYLIGGFVWQEAVYGAVFNETWALRLSPFLFYFERVTGPGFHYFASNHPGFNYGRLIAAFAVWILIGAAIFTGAALLYKRRKSELAGQTQPGGLLQLIAKLFTVFCAGALFMAIFSDRSIFTQVIAIIVSGIAIGLLAELILSRGIKSIPKNIKWLAIAGVVYSLLYAGIYLDVLGHATRLPNANNIASVSISYRGRFEGEASPGRFFPELRQAGHGSFALTDPESIAIVRDVHQRTVNDHVQRRTFMGDPHSRRWGGNHFAVTYHLRSGRTFQRTYWSVSDENFLLLATLEGQADFIAANHPLFFMEDVITQAGNPLTIRASLVSTTGDMRELSLTDAQLRSLTQALREDMLREPLDEILDPVRPVVGYVVLFYSDDPADHFLPTSNWWGSYTETWIPLTEGYTGTLALLRSLDVMGLLEGNYESVSEIIITDLFDIGFHNRVLPIDPGRNFDHFYWVIRDRMDRIEWRHESRGSSQTVQVHEVMLFSLTDPDDIAFVMSRGHSTLLLNEENSRRVLAMQVRGENHQVLSSKYILVDDLPTSIRREVALHIEDMVRQRLGSAEPVSEMQPVTPRSERAIVVASEIG